MLLFETRDFPRFSPLCSFRHVSNFKLLFFQAVQPGPLHPREVRRVAHRREQEEEGHGGRAAEEGVRLRPGILKSKLIFFSFFPMWEMASFSQVKKWKKSQERHEEDEDQQLQSDSDDDSAAIVGE